MYAQLIRDTVSNPTRLLLNISLGKIWQCNLQQTLLHNKGGVYGKSFIVATWLISTQQKKTSVSEFSTIFGYR